MNELVRTPASPWLDGLNTAQSEAVKTLDGPLLVLSGAGTGKTRVLTSRLAELVASGTANERLPNTTAAGEFSRPNTRAIT